MKLSQRLAIGYIRTKFNLLSAISAKKAAEQAFELFCTPLMRFRRKDPPANAEGIQLKIKNNTIKGYRWNYPQTNKVLILHGFNSAAYKFEHYVAPLVAKGYEVMAFDAAAHGESDGKKTNALEYAELISKIIEVFGPIQKFIAHSFGGIALSLALEGKQLPADTRIVLIAPATETTTAIDAAFSMLGLKSETVRKEFDRLIEKVSGHPPEWFSIRRAIKNIDARVMWIHDENDDITPLADALKVKSDNLPHVEFVITKELGHRKIYHDKNVKNAVINFL